jgi:hypothetical protein
MACGAKATTKRVHYGPGKAASLPVILLNKVKRASFRELQLPDESKKAIPIKQTNFHPMIAM